MGRGGELEIKQSSKTSRRERIRPALLLLLPFRLSPLAKETDLGVSFLTPNGRPCQPPTDLGVCGGSDVRYAARRAFEGLWRFSPPPPPPRLSLFLCLSANDGL